MASSKGVLAETTLSMVNESKRGDNSRSTAGSSTGEVKGGEDGEDGEEEKLVGEPRTMQQKAAAHNIGVANYQVGEVIEIMKENVEKVLERDAKLGEMEQRAEILYEGASAFQKSAGSLKNKAMWANMKQTIILVVLGLILVLIGAYYFGFI